MAQNNEIKDEYGVVYSADGKTLIRCNKKKRLDTYQIKDGCEIILGEAFRKCTGLASITIPTSVTKIRARAFERCTGLKNITIPNSVTEIRGYAFAGCKRLTSIAIPSSVTRIGDYAFLDCTGLTSITIPSSVTYIGARAFECCTGLKNITIPNGVTEIGDYAFLDCTGLTSITIPTSVTEIGRCAFSGCTGLTSITIPSSVTKIGDSAFGCNSLISISVDADNPKYSSVDGILYDKKQKRIVYVPKSISMRVTIPDSVTKIKNMAFAGCKRLTSITIPSSVTKIGKQAFFCCTSLTSITIPNSVTEIGDYAFLECTGLTSITIPNSVTEIGRCAFSHCTGLKILNYNANSCSGEGFSDSYDNRYYLNSKCNWLDGCDNLETVNIGDNVKIIPMYFIYGKSKVTSISMPNSVTTIEKGAFDGCMRLISISVYADNPNYSSMDGILYNKKKTEIIFVPKEAKLGHFNIPKGITTIGKFEFFDCTGLISIEIPDSVTYIGEYNQEIKGKTNVEIIPVIA